jgi:hypothetical protein
VKNLIASGFSNATASARKAKKNGVTVSGLTDQDAVLYPDKKGCGHV